MQNITRDNVGSFRYSTHEYFNANNLINTIKGNGDSAGYMNGNASQFVNKWYDDSLIFKV